MHQKPNTNSHLQIAASPSLPETQDLSFLETVLEDLQDEVYVYACDTLRFRYMNGAARKHLGWTMEETRSKCIHDTVATFDTDAFHRKTAPLLDGRQDMLIVELTFPSGPIEVSTKLLKTKDEGNFFLSVVRDLSRRKTLENAKLQTVSTVSHELRTPLTSIHGALRLLQAGAVANLDENTRGIVDIASRNTDRLLSIVNDILDFEKIKGNKMDFSITQMDIIQCLHETLELVSGIAAENDVTLDVETQFDSAMVLGNPDRVAQVITNFASNAIKYSPKGGTVTFGVKSHDGSILFSVSDEGPGIAREHQTMLFKPFSQARAGDGSKRPGTGLGLAIVAAILHRLEYPVECASDVGKGSTFSFRIPEHLVVQTKATPRKTTGAA
jgi:PAS domain S-box-containing protein